MAKLTPRNTYTLVLGGVIIIALSVALLALTGDPRTSIVPMRILAFMAYLLAVLSILGVLYTRELVQMYGRKFIDVHHIMTVSTLVIMVLHPLTVITLGGYPVIYLLPDFTSLFNAFARSGPLALLLFALASLVALLRAQLKSSWRMLHWMVYLGFLIASVHGALLGYNLQGVVARVVVGLFAVGMVVIYVLKRTPRKLPAKRV